MTNKVVAAARFNAPSLVMSLAIIFEWLLSLVKSLGDLLFAKKSNEKKLLIILACVRHKLTETTRGKK